MPLGVTIFGIGESASSPVFCYAFIRLIRGAGDYPAPGLPENRTVIPQQIPLGETKLVLFVWDTTLDEAAAGDLQSELDQGNFTIPNASPIEPGRSISGERFGPILVVDRSNDLRISGTGVVSVKGIAVSGAVQTLLDTVRATAGPGHAPVAIRDLIKLVSEQSGLGAFFVQRQRIGVVDYFYRRFADLGAPASLLAIQADKPDPGTAEPVRNVRIRRNKGAPSAPLRLRVVLQNYDEILTDALFDFPLDQDELVIAANSHITEFEVAAFDADGNIVDREGAFLVQGFNFGITVQGPVEDLAPVFRGAPESEDLHRRPRIHPTAFASGLHDRSAGLGSLRNSRSQLTKLIGHNNETKQSAWFESGGEGQIDVIRWIKKKLETPGVRHAYLVDPYLGSEALRRIILRQGNETITVTMVLSPGKLNPDAEEINERTASGDYLQTLVKRAGELSTSLCGDVSIVHIRRGDGSRPAFHDRYLSIVDQDGTPTVYLFSNSLSKAAGDWPFAICEFNRPECWRIHTYILDLIKGEDRTRRVEPEVIWASRQSHNQGLIPDPGDTQPPAAGAEIEWVKAANALLRAIQKPDRSVGWLDRITKQVNVFIEMCPHGVDTSRLADAIVRSTGNREEIIMHVSALLSKGNSEQRDVANKVDELMLDHLIDNIASVRKTAVVIFPFQERGRYLQYIASTIARKGSPTNFIRKYLNPVLQTRVQILETQRSPYALGADALDVGICVVSIGLEVAARCESVADKLRVGMATDYIHWLGRLLRSDIANTRYGSSEDALEIWMDDLAFAAQQVLRVKGVLGEALQDPVRRLSEDPLLVSRFKLQIREGKSEHSEPSDP